jgi:hypothetical protein
VIVVDALLRLTMALRRLVAWPLVVAGALCALAGRGMIAAGCWLTDNEDLLEEGEE